MDQPLLFPLPYGDSFQQFCKVAERPFAQFFDSAGCPGADGRYSYIVCDPLEVFDTEDTALDDMAQALSRFELKPIEGQAPFQGGLAGYLGYELLHQFEDVPHVANESQKVPTFVACLYDGVFAFDHHLKTCTLFVCADDEAQAQERAHHFLALYEGPVNEPPKPSFRPKWRADFTELEFCERVRRVIDYIYEGDIFQANLTQRFQANLPDDYSRLGFYQALRNLNPAPFSAFQSLNGLTIASSSPERFLKVEGARVETCPIKGTRARHQDKKIDQRRADELLHCLKDRAENTMIVDLLRNDLSRVCKPHSVQVPELCELYSFASVHHLISKVQGVLQDGKTALDLLAASFPGGSITGAPKVRAMEVIAELEACPRGPYCGSLFWAGFNGNFDSNIVIRTAVFSEGSVSVQVGAGIVSDSDPQLEYQETMDKAKALFRTFDGEAP